MSTLKQRSWTVLLVFIAATSAVGGLLILSDPNPAPRVGGGYAAVEPAWARSAVDGTVLQTAVPAEPERWDRIVIFHSGGSQGTPESIARSQQSDGIEGLGFHFLIGNGRGMGEGELHVGYRWNQQMQGAFGRDGAIGICLVGNGDVREFSEDQLFRLVDLVRSLQAEFGITADRVHLASELGRVSSPGLRFPTVWFREQLSLTGNG